MVPLLGGFYTFDFTTASVAGVTRDKICDQLKRIDSLLVRSEYKVYKVYAEYLLNSYRFIFSVHDLTRSQVLNWVTLRVLPTLT